MTALTHLGDTTKSVFLKRGDLDTLAEEFEVNGLAHSLTFSAALVASNVINGSVGGTAIDAITYASSSDASLAAVAAAIAAMPGVDHAEVVENPSTTSDDRVIMVYPTNQETGIPLTGFAVTAGASQATITVANVDGRVRKGQPVELDSYTGKIRPATASTLQTTCIGTALHDSEVGEMCTVTMKAANEVYAVCATAVTPGPVCYDSYDERAKTLKCNQTSVTAAKLWGWALQGGAIGDTIVVAIL